MNSLFHGDCLELMKQIPDGSVDMILTDPPYGTTACTWDNVIPFEPMWAQVWRVLKPNGACLLFGSEPFSSALRMSQIKRFKYDWVWYKNQPTGVATAKIMPMKKHELVSVFYREKCNYYRQLTDCAPSVVKRWKDKQVNFNQIKLKNSSEIVAGNNKYNPVVNYKINPHSVLQFDVVPRATGTLHPTQKPVALLEYLIKTYTLEGETVLDFTMGSGSTGVACVNTKRNFIGIEMDDKYFEIASKRIAEAKPSGELWS